MPTTQTVDKPVSTARAGMGAVPHENGVAFRVWAPHATAVAVIGGFNQWKPDADRMASESNGYWYADVPAAGVGDEYRFLLTKADGGTLNRIDPYAKQVTSSVGNAVVADPDFDWGDGNFTSPYWNEMVIYELHVGTFNQSPEAENLTSKLASVTAKFGHLKRLGINTIQVMPIAEFAGDLSWGYNPAHIFAVESGYGGPAAFKQFVKDAHANGFAVVVDVVYNHFGPGDLDIWQFDGWSENGGGGIYFYNDWRKETPWGGTRPDYGRPEVREYIRDNALMWLGDYRVDGLRMDMTLYIRSVRADGEPNLPEGFSLLQWMNSEVRQKFPNAITIAEDLQKSDALTAKPEAGGAGFGSQWDDQFVHPVREAVITMADEHRSMDAVAKAITHRYNDDAFQRVIYSESHDEVSNGRARVPHEIDPSGANGYFAQKRSTLAAALVFTAPGIPMIFQGQEFLEGEWFRDTVPVDWDKRDEFRGIVRLYRDLIRLRLNYFDTTRGLSGQSVELLHVNDDTNMIAFRRWKDGGRGDEVVVVLNFHRDGRQGYAIDFPATGTWKLRLNSDWKGYSEAFHGDPTGDVDVAEKQASIDIAPYSVLIFSQDRG